MTPTTHEHSILLALSIGPLNGAEIGQQLISDSAAAAYIKPPTLYLNLRRLQAVGLIEPANDSFRKSYRLTKRGWKQLEQSIPRLTQTLRLASERLDQHRYV